MSVKLLKWAIAGAIVNFTGTTNVVNGPRGTFVELEINSNGTVQRIADGIGNAQLGDWIKPNSAAVQANYEVRFTQVSGAPPEIGVLNTWLDLSGSRAIGYSAPSTGESGVFTVEIRLGSNVLDSEDYTITN